MSTERTDRSVGGEKYIPATRWRVFSKAYDPILAATMRERRFRAEMLDRLDAALPQGGRVLDVGCGTGTFAIAVAARRPDAEVIAIDGDEEILAMARAKRGAEAVEWRHAFAEELPLGDATVDIATMSLVLHHLLPQQKRAALAEVRRVLKGGSAFYFTDFGAPQDPLMSAVFVISQAFDGFDRTGDHRAGRIPGMIAAAGLEDVRRFNRLRAVFGTLDLLEAKAPASSSR